MRRRIWTLGMAVMLSTLAACSGGGHKAAQPPPAPGPNPDVIPAVITPAYVNAVFRVLNHIDGNVSRSLVTNKTMTSSDSAMLRSIYGDPLYQQEVQIAVQSVSQGFSNVRIPPGDITTTVVKLIDASPGCVFAETSSDFSKVLKHAGTPAASEYYRLSPKDPSTDPHRINPTPWTWTFNADYPSSTNVPDQCAAQ